MIDQLHALLQSMVGERQGGAEVSPRDDVASIRQAEDEQARANTAQARVLMIVGAIVLVGGLIVTGVSFAAASSGGAYVFAYGAMLAGFLLLIRGLTKRTRDR